MNEIGGAGKQMHLNVSGLMSKSERIWPFKFNR